MQATSARVPLVFHQKTVAAPTIGVLRISAHNFNADLISQNVYMEKTCFHISIHGRWGYFSLMWFNHRCLLRMMINYQIKYSKYQKIFVFSAECICQNMIKSKRPPASLTVLTDNRIKFSAELGFISDEYLVSNKICRDITVICPLIYFFIAQCGLICGAISNSSNSQFINFWPFAAKILFLQNVCLGEDQSYVCCGAPCFWKRDLITIICKSIGSYHSNDWQYFLTIAIVSYHKLIACDISLKGKPSLERNGILWEKKS